MTLNLTKQNFRTEALQSEIPVLIDFWASWCGPCRMLTPVIDEIAEEQKGKIKVAKINVDDEQELAAEFGVMSIPTLIVIKSGEVTASATGLRPKEDILRLLEA